MHRNPLPDCCFCRLSRDEKLFNRDLEQAMAKSDNIISLSSAQGDQSITSSSSSRSEEPSGDPLDDSAYIPGNNKHSDSDEDFEPSPPAKKLKKSEDKKVKRKPIKKENVKTAAKSASGVSTVAGTDMLGSGPLPTGSQSQVGQQTVSITNVTPVRRKGVAKWVPPARVGGNASTTKGSAVPPVRSGGAAPAIRVGLSRKAPIKPLHSVQSPLQTRK